MRNSLAKFVPCEVSDLKNPQTDIPGLAKDKRLVSLVEEAAQQVPSRHLIYRADSRYVSFLEDQSVHLVVTSPPYWTLKQYNESVGQLGYVQDYEDFLSELDKVWEHCFRVLVPGGRLVCVVGDVCLSRRRNNGRHVVVPLHSSIQEHCRLLGFDNLTPIIWNKISNASYEANGNGAGFLGKPYEPNSVVKNDIEFILMQRKPGGYRQPSLATRILSVISEENHRQWFQAIWQGPTGASTKVHPAPFPELLAERLVRMFSFVGDTVLDPFLGTGTTSVASAKWGRNSVGVEVDEAYHKMAVDRLNGLTANLFSVVEVVSCDDARSNNDS